MFLDGLVNSLHNSLRRYPEALAYLRSRLVTDEEIDLYRIGYGAVVGVPEEAGPERERFMNETWRGRKLEKSVLFPFQDALGRVVGCAGRTIESKNFKTFATEEAKFNGFFFGLPQALPHVYRENLVYVVEGYFDLLAFRKVYPNTVATITSGINDPQHDQLAMYCDSIVTCFDSDDAGRLGRDKAQTKWGDVRSMELGFKDPAACLERLGTDEFKKFVLGKASAAWRP